MFCYRCLRLCEDRMRTSFPVVCFLMAVYRSATECKRRLVAWCAWRRTTERLSTYGPRSRQSFAMRIGRRRRGHDPTSYGLGEFKNLGFLPQLSSSMP